MWQSTTGVHHGALLVILTSISQANGSENRSLRSVWSLRLASPSARILTVATDDIIGIWPGRLFSHGFQNLPVGNQSMTLVFGDNMDMTVVLGLHKFSLQVTIDHNGPSLYSGHFAASINCCKRTFYCNDSKIAEFKTIDTKNSSTAFVVMYNLIT